jgi:hypothetical protein
MDQNQIHIPYYTLDKIKWPHHILQTSFFLQECKLFHFGTINHMFEKPILPKIPQYLSQTY